MLQPRKPDIVELVAALFSQFVPRTRVEIADQIMERTLTESIKDSQQTLSLAESVSHVLTTRELVGRNGNVTGQFEVKQMRAASISRTRTVGMAAYPGASKFSFKHPKSKYACTRNFAASSHAKPTSSASITTSSSTSN